MFWQLLNSEKGVVVPTPAGQSEDQKAIASWLLGWFAEAPHEEKEAMVQAVYGLWLARNDARDGRRIMTPFEVVQSVYSYW